MSVELEQQQTSERERLLDLLHNDADEFEELVREPLEEKDRSDLYLKAVDVFQLYEEISDVDQLIDFLFKKYPEKKISKKVYVAKDD
jgi:hypothetical protein